jgi:hypothetical protein
LGSSLACVGQSIQLSDVSQGGTWISTNVPVATIGSGSGILTGVTIGTTTISYTSCAVTVTKTVTVNNAIPAVTAVVSPSPICAGFNSSLSSSITSSTIYSVSATTYALSAITTPVGTLAGDDVNTGAVTLPFTFNFYGADYTSLYICSNGWVSFTNAGTNLSNTTIPSATAVSYIGAGISLGMFDMNTGSGGSISYGYSGTAPNRKFIIYYNGVADFGGGAAISGQIILNEGSNLIDEMLTLRNPSTHPFTMGIQSLASGIAFLIPSTSPTSSASVED